MWPFRKRDERAIFRYFDGVKERAIDPIFALRALDAHQKFHFDEHAKQLLAGDFETTKIAVDAIREIFGVQPWSENSLGLTEGETLALLWKFVAYNDDIKKNISPPLTSPPPTGQNRSEPSTARPAMASGSISSAQNGG
jgi:hypothetical protein